ncbi:fibronectin type-III domain-containing protein 3A isoform X2 [Toxorhynchites rutilus septentrionalis]|uniref:fibronectin type-III domain-containing protein 3A isoform X2 n=1 Tax=Toxorhynchites rutilus septentrionalis TaxID=329112 RepID=UPI00247AA31F|nr:fibronectin type-III domain-containing protein 3A isoform X2 [Toxorhynchites rutilus septentrionalis]XP_055644683.1 fibronectin type-III domain-containing protein 3A isoform X2 [Toxorhynchites rutilus septentrionalis]XP_055644684.1 fibronectin type-III domain-containing protein 3A isoform X2 [Toxorhynchites rutilus septentrionalis]XP_055644685.1 fibronectin type-III domain-containing protein 3A isoform X2 [Toxorhynchites rutilus septentrionalis]
MVRRAVSTSPETPAHLNHHISQAQTPTSSTSSLSSSSDSQQQHSPQQQQQPPSQQQHSPQSQPQQSLQHQQHHPQQHLQTPPHHHAHVQLPAHENGHSIYLTAPYSPEYYPEHSYYLPHPDYGPASQHSHICPVHDYGPVTVPMVSQNGTPPMAMPVQVPPGHVMQQIVDENGTLRHVILSTQHQQLGQGGVQHHLHGHFINGTTPQFFNPLAASYQAGPGPGAPHIYQPPIITGGAGTGAATATGGAGGGSTHTHTPQSNVTHSPSPPHAINSQYHKDDRTLRQHAKLLRKLEQKQREQNASITTPINSPRKYTEVNGNVRKHQHQHLQHQQPLLQHHHLQQQQQQQAHLQHQHQVSGVQRNGTSSVATSEDGEESSSMPEEEDDTQTIIEHLSSVQSPQVNEITSRSALFQWSAPNPLPPNETLPFNVQDLHYELLLSDPGKENKYKSIFKGSSLSCMVQDLRPGQEYTVRLQVYLEQLHGSPTEATIFNTPPCEPDIPKTPTLLARTKNSLQLRWNAATDNGAHITNYILEYDNGKYNGMIHLINSQNCDFVEVCKTKGKQFTVNKLHPSTCYIFRLAAVNEYGRSGYSDLVKFNTAGNPPSQPAPPTLHHATSTSLKLAWQRRSPSDGFTLQMNQVDQGYGFKNIYAGMDNVYECTNLTRATTFQFRVKAENENGQSPFSKEVVFKTLPSCPDRPSKLQVKGKIHATAFKVKWDPPADTGGASINLYHLEINSGSLFERIYSGKDCEALIERLSPGTAYQIRVLCEGPGGISTFSDPCVVTTEPVVPRAPPRPYCNGAPTPYAACLMWDKPDYNGGAPVLEYEMEVETTNKLRNSCYRGKEQFCVVKDLSPGEMYTVQVRAINRIGASDWSEEYCFHAGAARPDPPSEPSITVRSPTHLIVIWEEPHCNGAPISEYILQSSTRDGDDAPFQTVYHGQQRIAELKNLVPFTTYHFRVCAVNSAGSSRYSSTFSQKTPAAPPNVPVLGQYKITAKSILICWETPLSNGAPVTHYNIECGDRVISSDASSTLCRSDSEQECLGESENFDADDDEEYDEDEDILEEETPTASIGDTAEVTEADPSNEPSVDDNPNLNRNELLIDDLHPETSYKLRIQAVNEIGTGPFSTFIKFTTAPLPPKPPKLECIQFGFSHLKLRWGEGKNLADLARYYVELENNRTGEYQNVYTGTRSMCKVMKLHELTAYTFRIAVETKHAGMGDYSEDFVFVTTAATPNTIKAPRVYIEPLGGGGSGNNSPQHPPASVNGSVNNLHVVQGSTHLTTGGSLPCSGLLTIEWQTSRNNPFADPIEYALHMAKAKDHEFHEIYRGSDTRHTIHNLSYGVGYVFKVCPVRVRSNGEEIFGQFSPILHHQLTPHRISSSSHTHSRHHPAGHDEVDGGSCSASRTYFAGNMVNSRGELILANAAVGGQLGSGPFAGHHSQNSINAQTLLQLPKGNLIQTLSELFEADSSKAVIFVLIFIVLSMIVAACLK